MPALPNLLKVEHILQNADSDCLSACVQMVTRFLGREISQTTLSALFQALPEGVPASRTKRLRDYGFQVIYDRDGNLDTLLEWIRQGIPPIVFLQTGILPYWQVDTAHAVVIVGLTNDTILLNDPALPDAPQVCPLELFLHAWSEFENRFAVITL